MEKTDLRVGIINHDGGRIAEDTKDFLKGIENVNISAVSEAEGKSQVAAGELDCVITFEQGFSQSVQSGEPAHIAIASVKGAEITGFVKSYVYHYIDNIAAIGKSAQGNEKRFEEMYKNYRNSETSVKTSTIEDTAKNRNMTERTVGFLLMAMLFQREA